MDDLTFTCPVCGADVPHRAKSCPECGACEKSGWSADRHLDGLNLPDESFNYEQFTALEFGRGPKKTGKQRLWLIVAIVVVIALVWLTRRGLW
jgi:hypothetical protein